ncbi:MAG: cation diffusion facilitator family transporter [Deltaproteobacteria bacterium]|nr:cation diffusion facilitator family transporter [Candidatus Deferrimicrobiaceae bacterium]
MMRQHAHAHLLSAGDPVLAATRQASRAVLWSFAGLCATAIFQAVVAGVTGSVALLADTIHNAGDAATAIPLWIAFRVARRKPDNRFTYGFGRVEDLAGVIVVAVIFFSAIAAAVESARRFAAPVPVTGLWAVAAASAIGFVGNEAVALYRIRAGNRLGSAALVADGYHARADGLASLGVLLGAAGVAAGFPAADPAAGLLICAFLLKTVWDAGKEVFLRLLDGVEPEVVEEIRAEASATPGVEEVTEVRVRWSGHRIYADVNLAVAGDMPVAEGHSIASEARHRLMHRLTYLSDATIHVDPVEASGTEMHKTSSHAHGGLPGHSH